MLYKTLSAAVYGIDANLIEVEVDISGVKTNEEQFYTVGLPDAAVKESRQRELEALIAPETKAAIDKYGIRLASYRDLN